MRGKIIAGIRDLNPLVFTSVAILLSVILVTGLNLIFIWFNGGEIDPKIFLYITVAAILMPLVIAPVLINMFKRVTALEQVNQQLQGQIEQHQRAQQLAEERVANLQAISDFALTCAAAAPEADLPKLIAEKLQAITGALGVAISEYDASEQALITRHMTVSGQILSTLNKLLGRNIIGLRSPMSPSAYQRMFHEVVAAASDLNEVSFGAIPKPVSALIQKTFGVGDFTGLAFIYGGELWGAAMIVMRKGQAPIDRELGLALANVAALAMQRQKTEEALQASEERYRLISTVSSDYMFSARLNEQGQMLLGWVAGAFESITGYTPDEYRLLGGWSATLHPDDVDKVTRDMSALEEKRPAVTEARILTKTGQARWVRFYAHPVWEAGQNRLTGVYGAVQDISAHKEAEAREKFRREMLEKVIRLGKVVTQITNPKQCQLKIRESVQKELGFDRVGLFLYEKAANRVQGTYGTDENGQLEDTSWYCEPASDDSTWKMVLDSVDGVHFVEHYDRVYDPTKYKNDMLGVGQHVTVSAWAGDKPVAFIAADNLLTQRKFTAEQIEGLQLFAGYAGLAIHNSRWNEELEERVAERTIELEASNRELESLSYNIAHDMRSPVRAMVGYAVMLQQSKGEKLDDEGRADLEIIHISAKRLGQLIDDFLAYLRMGRVLLRKQPVKTADLVKKVVDDVFSKNLQRQIQFSIGILPDCQADPAMLEQAWAQLVSNAVKFTGLREMADIEIGADEKDGKACYFVRDNGIGFNMKYAEKIFAIFQHLNRQDEYEGTGMGLAIARRIIERHGGRIWAEAEVDKGATFCFTLE